MGKSTKQGLKFWGKFIVYVGQVCAVIAAVKLNSVELVVLSLFAVFVGCVMHEFSED